MDRTAEQRWLRNPDALRRLPAAVVAVLALTMAAVFFSPVGAATALASTGVLGGLDLDSYCQSVGYSGATLTQPRYGTGAAYNNWVCYSASLGQSGYIDMVTACAFQYPNAAAEFGSLVAYPTDPNDAWTWVCAPPVTADLGVALTTSSTVVVAGATSGPQVEATVSNGGPGDAHGVSVVVESTGGAFTAPTSGCAIDSTQRVLTCTSASLPAQGSVQYGATLTDPSQASASKQPEMPPSVQPPPTITLTASVFASTTDPNATNNDATAVVGIAEPSSSVVSSANAYIIKLAAYFLEQSLSAQVASIAAQPEPQRPSAVSQLTSSAKVAEMVNEQAAALIAQGAVTEPPGSTTTQLSDVTLQLRDEIKALVIQATMG